MTRTMKGRAQGLGAAGKGRSGLFRRQGFSVRVTGAISLMPGTSSDPAFRRVDVDMVTGKGHAVERGAQIWASSPDARYRCKLSSIRRRVGRNVKRTGKAGLWRMERPGCDRHAETNL